MTTAGGSRAYGEWAVKHIKSRHGVCFATFLLGVLIFVDDYFNCLTVGSVMRPVTDKFKVSRAKLAYFIDATAAPVCIIAPISSWAAAVSGDLFTTPRRVNAEDVPAIIILTFAWTLKTMTSLFEAGQFVSGVVQNAFVVLGIFAVLMLTVLFGIKLYRKAQRS